MEIIIDDREYAVMPFFEDISIGNRKNPITYKKSRINYGDYSFNYKENIIFIIERKTWKDLAQSIKDGRKENINKLIELRNRYKCKIFYLIEGNPIPDKKTKFCRISYKNLRAHLDHLMLRDNIHILHSRNQKNTVERIYELINNYLSIKPSPLLQYDIEQIEFQGGDLNKITIENIGIAEGILKQKPSINEDTILYKIWCCIPSITEKTAYLFINKKYHISDLILGKISKNDIYSLKYDNGYIVGKRSDKIWKYSQLTYKNNNKVLDNIKYYIKILSQINGITKTSASIILDEINFGDLLNNNVNIDTLQNIKISDKRKLGKKKSEIILKYLCK